MPKGMSCKAPKRQTHIVYIASWHQQQQHFVYLQIATHIQMYMNVCLSHAVAPTFCSHCHIKRWCFCYFVVMFGPWHDKQLAAGSCFHGKSGIASVNVIPHCRPNKYLTPDFPANAVLGLLCFQCAPALRGNITTTVITTSHIHIYTNPYKHMLHQLHLHTLRANNCPTHCQRNAISITPLAHLLHFHYLH